VYATLLQEALLRDDVGRQQELVKVDEGPTKANTRYDQSHIFQVRDCRPRPMIEAGTQHTPQQVATPITSTPDEE
jgi:hypothetical protein